MTSSSNAATDGLQIALPQGIHLLFEFGGNGDLWVTRDALNFEPAELVISHGTNEFRSPPVGSPHRHHVPASALAAARAAGAFTLSLVTTAPDGVGAAADTSRNAPLTVNASDASAWWSRFRDLLDSRSQLNINLTRKAGRLAWLPIAALARPGERLPVGRLSRDDRGPFVVTVGVSQLQPHAAVLLLAEGQPPRFLHPALRVPVDRAPAFNASTLVKGARLSAEVWFSAPPAGQYCLLLLLSSGPTAVFEVLGRVATGTAELGLLMDTMISDTDREVIGIGHLDIELVDTA